MGSQVRRICLAHGALLLFGAGYSQLAEVGELPQAVREHGQLVVVKPPAEHTPKHTVKDTD